MWAFTDPYTHTIIWNAIYRSTTHHGMVLYCAHSIISIVVGSSNNNTSSRGIISEILCTILTPLYEKFINTATPSYSTKSTIWPLVDSYTASRSSAWTRTHNEWGQTTHIVTQHTIVLCQFSCYMTILDMEQIYLIIVISHHVFK
jgi:hypothetical protein